MLADVFEIFASRPDNDFLSEREDNEAYVLVNPGQQYAVYFPEGGDVNLNFKLQLRWLNINTGTWLDAQYAEGGDSISLQAPGSGQWAVVIQKD